MSSIWHKLPEQPEKGRDVLEKWHHLGIHYTHFVAKNGIAEDNPFTDAWCYLEDLLALEAENKDLSDKIGKLETELERTRKALDVAVDKLKGIKAYYDDSYADPHTFVNWHIVAQRLANDADDTIKTITALEKSELENLEMLVNNVFK